MRGWQIGSGHMGATPQPNRTVASDDNQRRRFRNSGVSNLSGINQRSGESIDTVGVTGSIPVSPTPEPPRFWGVQSFPGMSRAALGPHECWLALASDGSGVARMWPHGGDSSARGGFASPVELWSWRSKRLLALVGPGERMKGDE
jgi:hypothetical protein